MEDKEQIRLEQKSLYNYLHSSLRYSSTGVVIEFGGLHYGIQNVFIDNDICFVHIDGFYVLSRIEKNKPWKRYAYRDGKIGTFIDEHNEIELIMTL